MKTIETLIHLRRERPTRLRAMTPPHICPLVEPYGLQPQESEQSPRRIQDP